MSQRLPLLERAFELARSGECKTWDVVARRLKAEGYIGVDAALAGPSLRRQLRELCRGDTIPRKAEAS